MNHREQWHRRNLAALLGLVWILFVSPATSAEAGKPSALANFGPYNASFLAGGVGITVPLAADSPILPAGAPWSLTGWVRSDRTSAASLTIATLGESGSRDRCLLLDRGRLQLRLGAAALLQSRQRFDGGSWHAIAATYDGHQARLYVDGNEAASRVASTPVAAASFQIAPESNTDLTGEHHFGGDVAEFLLHDRALDVPEIRALSAAKPDFGLIYFHQVGVGWPWQERAWRGLQEPQAAWTLPRSHAPFSRPTVSVIASGHEALLQVRENAWKLGAWHLAAAASVSGAPDVVSSAAYPESNWYTAVVPGTVLTTLIANGVYPDSDYGLNNLAIPESLNRQDYWYRSSFTPPAEIAGKRSTLTFKGINYAAEVWLNGAHIGDIRGAFIRGIFDVTSILRPGSENVIAVRVSPPPHPGIPHEQSVAAGPGENGGNLAIDGPTFIATEGWDWIPAIRDRNTGIWQDVELSTGGDVRILDPQVITLLSLPRTDTADVIIRVPVRTYGTKPVSAVIDAAIGDVHVQKLAVFNPGVSQLELAPAEFPQLRFAHPRLWWPNGYGSPELYTLTLVAQVSGLPSDAKAVRFGIRQITYELSLFDHHGSLRRVEIDPAAASVRHELLVDVSHGAIKRTANGWAESLTVAGESSPAVHDIGSTSLTPYLAIRVNGVPIAARGGSWGMDDSRKRVSREHLEPFFRLHREAHLNIIRNWLGQNTEDVFYDLADEYGLLILNDFWASTQDFQVEPQDPQLFLQNARDVITRYRNHPSIAVWFGRNEGVPQPVLNEGLASIIAELDGTRYYTGSSNSVNLQGSGPYNWRPPEQYFTKLAQGFSVEVGTPSLATLESLQAWIPEADQWPLGDTYAYHDWHFGGNGDTASFMQALDIRYGAASSLEDFERKAQLMNYVSYRAIFEGFQSQLWSRNSGRLLWMTHPSWPSNAWQIYTSDYDTPAAYYAVAKACEPLHAQLDIPDFRPAVVNTTRQSRANLRLRVRILSLDNRQLLDRVIRVDAQANATTTFEPLALEDLLASERLVLIALTLSDTHDVTISENLYWQAREATDERQLVALPQQQVTVHATRRASGGDSLVAVELKNSGAVPALLAKLTVLNANGARVLPAFYSDNYVSLLPGESRSVEIRCPARGDACVTIALRGWNIARVSAPIVEH